ncbi:MAG TPA: hypothetical protein VFL71_20240 [Actinomycetes bacterium]|nr:hypothetical protein [Actinomycetes bacterium]
MNPGKGEDLAARMAALGARPPAATPAPEPMPAEQSRPAAYSARLHLTTTREQARALAQARVDDGIEVTARVRAMIALWQQDERLRRRIDKLARSWR